MSIIKKSPIFDENKEALIAIALGTQVNTVHHNRVSLSDKEKEHIFFTYPQAKEAVATNGDFEYVPSDLCVGEPQLCLFNTFNDCFEAWHVARGIRVKNGVIYDVRYLTSYDKMTTEDCCEIDSPRYETFFNNYSKEHMLQSWEAYLHQVVEIQDDYLDVLEVEAQPVDTLKERITDTAKKMLWFMDAFTHHV